MSPEHDHDLRRPDADDRAPDVGTVRPASEAVEKLEAPDAVRAARASRRRGTERQTPAAEVSRARGVEWVRPTDLIARQGAALAGRGVDFEVELARRTRAPLATGVRDLGERTRRLPPLAAFGRGSTGQAAPSRPGVGLS
ncbi:MULTISPECIES: hypothetical protein [Micrococcales]|uniref:hypothetical protein n=1 Tax=Micrococcales TaxID=85006 RepID=UPI000C420C94|nr:hypothetical protein [Brevibacterium sp. 239c]MDN5892438.1 hypothetical protein [Nocardioides sp.]SMX69674.1 hypothetical protein BSP239C_00378 [Brevibacterium sp. 239c]